MTTAMDIVYHSFGNPNPSFDFIDDPYADLEQLSIAAGFYNSGLEVGCYGGAGADQFSNYSTSPPDVNWSTDQEATCEDHQRSVGIIISDGAIGSTNDNMNTVVRNETKRKVDAERPQRHAFKTKTQLDVLDDGYRWRKYGKKSVKNSNHPRNYYKCTSGGCQVKKKIERWNEDSSFLITQYDGVHNHWSPSSAYYYNSHRGHFLNYIDK